jgi:hypothetical protein
MGKSFNTGTLVNGVAVLSNGNVGIGTSNPLTKIDCQSSSTGTITENAAFRDSSTNGNALQIWNGNNEARIRAVYYGTASDQSITFWTITSSGAQGERMRITANGNVGIGTSSPDALLRIDSNVASANNNMLYLYNADFTSTTRSFIRVRNNISAGSTYSSYFGQGADRKTYIIANDTNRNDLVINGDDGYIGMGTKNPSSRLTIIRDSPFNTGDQALRIRATDGDGYNLWMGASSNGYATIQSYQDNVGGRPLSLNPLNGGNVGIGTISPNGTLEVYAATPTIISGASSAASFHGFEFRQNNTIDAFIKQLPQTGELKLSVGRNSSWGGNMTFFTDTVNRMTITSVGYVYLGKGWGATNHRINLEVSQGNNILVVSGYSGSGNDTAIFYAVSGSSANAAGTGLSVSASSATGRAINAGGTLNANGTDYAEYMYKAVTDNIAKGDIVGVNVEGKLTNIFNDSISFVVKSTNPSYVGGDIWANEDILGKKPQRTTEQSEEEFAPILAEFEERVEAERQKVDRIAFSGQVPCNVIGANVGDYIIPIELSNGKISGQPVSNPTFEQYQISIGKVWKIMEDGRSWISVKIG